MNGKTIFVILLCLAAVPAVMAAPVQDFMTVNSHGFAPLTVTFTSISNVSNVTDYQWNYFRVQSPVDNWTSFSASRNTSFTFTNPGTYHIMMVEYSPDFPEGYISTTKTNLIQVSAPATPTPTPTITPTPTPTQTPVPSSAMGIAVFRPASGNWYFDYNMDGAVDRSVHFGTAGDIAATADINHDGLYDLIIFRPANGNWYIDSNRDGNVDQMFHFGTNGDLPFIGTFN